MLLAAVGGRAACVARRLTGVIVCPEVTLVEVSFRFSLHAVSRNGGGDRGRWVLHLGDVGEGGCGQRGGRRRHRHVRLHRTEAARLHTGVSAVAVAVVRTVGLGIINDGGGGGNGDRSGSGGGDRSCGRLRGHSNNGSFDGGDRVTSGRCLDAGLNGVKVQHQAFLFLLTRSIGSLHTDFRRRLLLRHRYGRDFLFLLRFHFHRRKHILGALACLELSGKLRRNHCCQIFLFFALSFTFSICFSHSLQRWLEGVGSVDKFLAAGNL
mmetsp:Transcript_23422/g.40522  ORF Transcript_23422/g.40522 Transcript_23422/m.40522 type:complete len:266 (+) Transcript_23422:299-1096(+)